MNEKTFTEMASRFLRASLDSWRQGNHAFAVLHAGVGCEHILKALLCRHNPLLIAEKGDQSFRFHSLGHGDANGVKPLSEARTIGILEAFKTAAVFMRGRMPVDERTFRPFADSRNGVAHSAYLDDMAVRKVIETGVQVVESVRAELGLDPAGFWGEYTNVFADLSQVASVPAPAGPDKRPLLEPFAQQLAFAARERARSAVSVALSTGLEAASWDEATMSSELEGDVTRTALDAALVTALRIEGSQAGQAAERLLVEHGVLPLPAPLSSHEDPGVLQRSHTAVTVKVMIASGVTAGLVDVQGRHRDMPLVDILIHLDQRGCLISSRASGDHVWWRECPACGYAGNVYGDLSPVPCRCDAWAQSCIHPGGVVDVGTVESFSCPFCGLSLSNRGEIVTAGIESRNEAPEEDW
ncbi:hypothetical protein [Streptomyces cyaneofuscatus]|uniref:hypothetical protein n=1 Tax=Streptomyces cyaneofuscatus TaxID=66883 RepID=UPI0004C49D9F|nr:hypothetical protein [Streptomyces cyaneofuscatus]